MFRCQLTLQVTVGILLKCWPVQSFTASTNPGFVLQHWDHRRQVPGRDLDIPRKRAGYASMTFSLKEKDESDIGSTTVAIGGNFVGYYAAFDSRTGVLIPVPEQYVPEVLVEWGQVPSCLEVLLVEAKEKDQQQNHFKRVTYTILPETGCAVDNLETLKTSESFPISPESQRCWQSSDRNAWLMWHAPIFGKRWRIECCFGWESEHDDSSVFRTRMSVDAIQQRSDEDSGSFWELVSPVRVWLERHIPDSVLDLVEGGGLDGRTVSALLGPLRMYQDFAAKKAKTIIDWQPPSNPKDFINTSLLLLPGNITFGVADYNEGLMLEMGHIYSENQRLVLALALQKNGTIQLIPGHWENDTL